ncbi:MAG: penicillin-binding protein 2 [Actinomycetota bacterium]
MATKSKSIRLFSLLAALFVGFGIVATRMFWLQIVDSSRLTEMAAAQRQRTLIVPAQRGSILASDGTELAISVDVKTVFADPHQVTDPGRTAEALAPVLDLEVGPLLEKITRDSGFVYLARKVDESVAAQVAQLQLPGIHLVPESKRLYPAGSLASQVVGFVGTENEGLGGLEYMYDDLLTGRDGKVMVERDPLGRQIPVGESSVKEAISGSDIILTLDRQIQHEAEAALERAAERWGAGSGSIVVMDPASREILAMANTPAFDPRDLDSSDAQSRRNRAVTDLYEPGSVTKVVTAAAGLESRVTSPAERMRVADRLKVGGKVFKDSHVHPVQELSFAEVIQSSSNVGTIQVAQRLGEERLYEYLRRFGFGRPTGIDFPAEASGILPEPSQWWGTSLGTISIGQSFAGTPIQVANAFATLAAGGLAAEPRLIKGTVGADGVVEAPEHPAPQRVIEQATARQVTDILVGVTEDEIGTGSAARVPGYLVAGKTGTAQKASEGGYSGYMATFAGFAPADNPRLVVSVVLDDPNPILAGQTAAVTFQEVMEFALRRLRSSDAGPMDTDSTSLAAATR